MTFKGQLGATSLDSRTSIQSRKKIKSAMHPCKKIIYNLIQSVRCLHHKGCKEKERKMPTGEV